MDWAKPRTHPLDPGFRNEARGSIQTWAEENVWYSFTQ